MRPVLLGIKGNQFRFEGGIVVTVLLDNIGVDCQIYCVVEADVRFYRLDAKGNKMGDKVKEIWPDSKLYQLIDHRPWTHAIVFK